MDCRFRPLTAWPGPLQKSSGRARFRSTWGATLALLQRELHHLSAHDVIVEIDVDEADIRLDGWPRNHARAKSPGVVLYFDSRLGPLCYPCDRYGDWQDNLRAIALSLQALRAVDRYGVTRRAEQYRGWKALPPPSFDATLDELADAAEMLSAITDGKELAVNILYDLKCFERARKLALLHAHPDHGGTDDAFCEVQKAIGILKAYHATRLTNSACAREERA